MGPQRNGTHDRIHVVHELTEWALGDFAVPKVVPLGSAETEEGIDGVEEVG